MEIPQKRRRRNRAASADGEPPEGLEDAAHVIVARGPVRAPAPEGFDEADVLILETGDELPLETGLQAFEGWPARLAVLDADGNHLAGGTADDGAGPIIRTPETPDRLFRTTDVDAAIEAWERGDTFTPREEVPA